MKEAVAGMTAVAITVESVFTLIGEERARGISCAYV